MNNDCLVNVDSAFDLDNIIRVAEKEGKVARVMLRLNPDIDSVSIMYRWLRAELSATHSAKLDCWRLLHLKC